MLHALEPPLWSGGFYLRSALPETLFFQIAVASEHNMARVAYTPPTLIDLTHRPSTHQIPEFSAAECVEQSSSRDEIVRSYGQV